MTHINYKNEPNGALTKKDIGIKIPPPIQPTFLPRLKIRTLAWVWEELL